MLLRHFLPLILPLILLCSCASVSVKDERRGKRQPVEKPARIYVEDFRTDPASYQVAGPAAKDLPAFKAKTADLLATKLVQKLDAHVAPAQRAKDVRRLPRRGWLVTGSFERVNSGNRWLRIGVGFGAGGTKLETKVAIYDLAARREPFLTFATTGGSNAMPGVILSSSPITGVINLVRQNNRGVPDDCARTSRMITGVLNEYSVECGWLPAKRRFSAKRLGRYQLLHEQYLPRQ